MPFSSLDYNQRLFSSGVRKWLHEMRFRWLNKETSGMSGSVFELGCFDARSITYLGFSPERYLGLDAGWEGGLDSAIAQYPNFEFRRSDTLVQPAGTFDLAIAMETLEHLPREQLPNYVDVLSRTAPVLLVTVPVEIGPVFLIKRIVKAFLPGRKQYYSVRELIFTTLGFTTRVEQVDHKGFDYRHIRNLLRSCYGNVKVEGLPFKKLPLFSFTVAIRAER